MFDLLKNKLATTFESTTLELFATPIGVYNFYRDFTEVELRIIENLEKRGNTGNIVSDNKEVLNLPELSEINDYISNCVNDYFIKTYHPDENTKLRITQSWCNYTSKEQYHHRHYHPNSFLSGVLYIQTDDSDGITFFNGKKNILQFNPEKSKYTLNSFKAPAKSKQLILFPSELEHEVSFRKADGLHRISLALNTFPVGQLGSKNEATELFV